MLPLLIEPVVELFAIPVVLPLLIEPVVELFAMPVVLAEPFAMPCALAVGVPFICAAIEVHAAVRCCGVIAMMRAC